MATKKGLIFNYFQPSLYVRSFLDINVDQLRRQGIKLVICDLDNTLVPHYTRLPNKDVTNFIKRVREQNMQFVIMSNNIKARVRPFAEKAGVEYYSNARKPFKKIAKIIIEKHDVNPKNVVVIGDQVLMDIWVANRIKSESILVQPLVSTDYKMNRFNMFLENRIYKNLEKRNILRQTQFADRNDEDFTFL